MSKVDREEQQAVAAAQVPGTDRASWSRAPGNPYCSDATYEVAVCLSSWAESWALIDKQGLRGPDGRVDAALFKTKVLGALDKKVIPSGTSSMRPVFADIDMSQVDWQEVADEFLDEDMLARWQARPADQALPPAAHAGPVKARAIDADVLNVLRCATADDRGITLGPATLDKNLYRRVDETLQALGGKWNSRQKRHLFAADADPVAILAVAAGTGTFVSPKDFGYFWTPQAVGRQALAALDLQPHHLVLEPEGGRGNLADLAAAIVGRENVHTCEMLDANRKVLEEKGYRILGRDFLEMEPEPVYDRILMNPPFNNGADLAHVRHAMKFLKPDGRLVAITSPSHRYVKTHAAQEFRDLLEMAGENIADIEPGAFREAGTEAATVIVAFDAERLPAEALTAPAARGRATRQRGG